MTGDDSSGVTPHRDSLLALSRRRPPQSKFDFATIPAPSIPEQALFKQEFYPHLTASECKRAQGLPNLAPFRLYVLLDNLPVVLAPL